MPTKNQVWLGGQIFLFRFRQRHPTPKNVVFDISEFGYVKYHIFWGVGRVCSFVSKMFVFWRFPLTRPKMMKFVLFVVAQEGLRWRRRMDREKSTTGVECYFTSLFLFFCVFLSFSFPSSSSCFVCA